jgi:hypothetical protein
MVFQVLQEKRNSLVLVDGSSFLAKTSDKLDPTIKKTRMSKGSRMN